MYRIGCFLVVVAACLQRRPAGLYVGTALQVPVVLTGLFAGVLWLLGGLFALLWLYLLQLRKDMLGSILPRAASAPRTGEEPPEQGRHPA